jgi:hypothetical protein
MGQEVGDPLQGKERCFTVRTVTSKAPEPRGNALNVLSFLYHFTGSAMFTVNTFGGCSAFGVECGVVWCGLRLRLIAVLRSGWC